MKQNKILIAAFALILVIPTLDSIFNFSPIKELFEKRKESSMPQTPKSFAEILAFPKAFDAFFNDHYGMRKTLITWHSKMMDKVFDESPSSRVVIGKEGWYYFNNYNSILDAQGQATITDELIAVGVEHYAKNRKQVEDAGMKYLLVIAADKTSIYPEFLPDYIKPAVGGHRIDKFLAALLKKYPDFPVVDARPILLKAKLKEKVYQETDTHWNRRGAHATYMVMMQKLGIKPNPRSKFKDVAEEWIKGDISDIMGNDASNLNYELEPKFKETINPVDPNAEEKKKFHNVTIFSNDNKNLPRLFVYQDSFFGDLFRFVSQHFSYALFTNQYPCDIEIETVKKYHPNVVMQEFWEGRVEHILGTCGQ
jgi:alginate O-acetyltransferase complex protein AlgJ